MKCLALMGLFGIHSLVRKQIRGAAESWCLSVWVSFSPQRVRRGGDDDANTRVKHTFTDERLLLHTRSAVSVCTVNPDESSMQDVQFDGFVVHQREDLIIFPLSQLTALS